MSFLVRFVTAFFTVIGVVAPLITVVVSGIIAKKASNLSRDKIMRGVKLCVALNGLAAVCTLALTMFMPWPLTHWAIATWIALSIGAAVSGFNLNNATNRLKTSVDGEEATARSISDAHSVASS